MSTPKKLPAGKGKAVGSAVVGMAVDKARAALSDPKTRQMLMEQGKAIADQAQQRRRDREGGSGGGGARRLSLPFGQSKLERRVENLRASLAALADGRPELGGALAPVVDVVDRLAISLDIAGRMPAVKRKQAHMRIDKELDQVEKDLFEHTFGSGDGQA